MTGDVESRLWDSAYDFRRVVLPILAWWLPQGRFVSVEDAPNHPAVKAVDTVAGIDGWVISEGSTRLQGIASRVQYGTEPYESFTIRARRPSGAVTKLAKRLQALRDRDEHYVVPHYTVQAWVERRRTGRALLVLMVRTQDLFAFVVDHPDKVERRRNPADGTEFLVVWADDLRAAGFDVKQGGTTYDVTIRQRGGQAYSPADLAAAEYEEEEDVDDVNGYWEDEEDDDGYCMYCAVGFSSSGEVCPARGTFRA
jgi:hypothetical protein